MKVAIAADSDREDSRVSEHFGKAEYFLIYEVGGNNLRFVEARRNPKAAGGGHFHETVARVLEDAEVVISAGMGRGAYSHLIADGKQVLLIPPMKVREAAEKYAANKLEHDASRLRAHHAHPHPH